MATVNVTPSALTAGTPAFTSAKVASPYLISPNDLSAGAPVLDDVRIVIISKPWPFRPMIPVTEELEWLTDLLSTRSAEQRIALRSAPRQSFSLSVRLDDAHFAIAKMLARARAGSYIGMPVWPEEVYVGSISSADTSIAIDTTYGDWRVDEGILLWQSNDVYAVARVTAISDTALTLAGPVGVDLSNASVFPLRRAFMPEGFSIDRQATYTDVKAKFQADVNVDLAADYVTSYPQYQSLDVVTEAPVLIENVSDNIVRAIDLIDSGLGPVKIETRKDYVDFGQTVSFMEERGSVLWARRLWLHSLRGKQKSFWLPSFNKDMVLQASILSTDTDLSVKATTLAADYVDRHVMFLITNGNRYFRQIVAAAADGANVTLTLSGSLGVAVAPSDIKLFCFITKMRLNADSVHIDHRYALQSVVSVGVTQLPN